MKNKYILSVDQGTTSCRAIVFDQNGKKLAVGQEEFTQYFPQSGWVEHDPIEIWDKQSKVILEAIDKANVSIADILAVGITNQRETTIVWDRETGKPIHNAIVWQDRRTSAYCDSLRTESNVNLIRSKTGLILDAYFSASKIRYILEHVDGAKEKANEGRLLFGTIDSWLIYNMTQGKEHLTDVTNASRTMIFNIKDLQWDEELCALFEIPMSVLPEVKACNGCFGFYEIEGYQIPIHGVAGDQQAALFGQLCTEKGMAKNTYGTGCFTVVNTGQDIVYSNNNLLSTIGWQIDDDVTYALEGSVFIGGAVIQWLRDNLGFFENAAESESLANSVDNSDGVTFVPALSGLGAPHWDQYARGLIIGITRGTTSAHITRAAIESIALQVADLLTAMGKDIGLPIEELRADGGAVHNGLLMQLQSDFIMKKVVVPIENETTALGVAYLAGLGVGLYKDISSLKLLWKAKKSYEPTNKNHNQTIQNWNEAIKRAKSWAQP